MSGLESLGRNGPIYRRGRDLDASATAARSLSNLTAILIAVVFDEPGGNDVSLGSPPCEAPVLCAAQSLAAICGRHFAADRIGQAFRNADRATPRPEGNDRLTFPVFPAIMRSELWHCKGGLKPILCLKN